MGDDFIRLASKWGIKWQFLKDIYFLMLNDARFSTSRSIRGARYAKMSGHLLENYRVDIKPHQLKYLVYLIRRRK